MRKFLNPFELFHPRSLAAESSDPAYQTREEVIDSHTRGKRGPRAREMKTREREMEKREKKSQSERVSERERER